MTKQELPHLKLYFLQNISFENSYISSEVLGWSNSSKIFIMRASCIASVCCNSSFLFLRLSTTKKPMHPITNNAIMMYIRSLTAKVGVSRNPKKTASSHHKLMAPNAISCCSSKNIAVIAEKHNTHQNRLRYKIKACVWTISQ